MHIVCTDLEGILVPEVWIHVAEKTGIEELKLTTRDVPDYDELMRKRLAILDEKSIKLKDITEVICRMEPLEGAMAFVEWLRHRTQLIVVSDTYEEFARPLMKKLGWPTLFCHNLTVSADGAVIDYNLRQKDSKRKAVIALKSLSYHVIAVGDSYNDISMLKESDAGILFRPPDRVKEEFPAFPVCYGYENLKQIVEEKLAEYA
jgi:phosphoserine/homoserine phosphotransferase